MVKINTKDLIQIHTFLTIYGETLFRSDETKQKVARLVDLVEQEILAQ